MSQESSQELCFQIASRFCFPRLSGTRGEVEAQNLAIKTFQKLGLNPIEEEFQASYLMINFLARLALFPWGVFLLLSGIFYQYHYLVSGLVFSFLALGAGMGFALYAQSSPKFLGWRKKHWSKNIYVCFSPEDFNQDILILAHYDSKSQSFPIWLRVLVYYLGGILSLLGNSTGIYLFLKILTRGIFHQWALAVFIIPALIDFLPLFNRIGNRSPGAVDNAGAVGVLFSLAESLKNFPLKKSRVWLVLTGAEELGLIGSREFLEKHQRELNPKSTYVINLDGLGGSYKICALSRLGFPGKSTSKTLNQKIFQLAEGRALAFKLNKVSLGFSTDAQPFLKNGYQAVSLGEAGRYIHTYQDSLDKLILQNLADYQEITQELILWLDQSQ